VRLPLEDGGAFVSIARMQMCNRIIVIVTGVIVLLSPPAASAAAAARDCH